MKNTVIFALCLSLQFTVACSKQAEAPAEKDDAPQAKAVPDAASQEQYISDAKTFIKAVGGKLMGEVKTAMKAGGPLAVISVCNTTAPKITAEMSAAGNQTIRRTSLKLRSPNNAPDDWEAAVLRKFETRRAAGEEIAPMAFHEIVETNGKKQFRFMKAIGMPPLSKGPCLQCHGTEIKPEIVAQIDILYPQDKARGYKAGEVRGAFSVIRDL